MFEDYYDSYEPTAIEGAYQEFVDKASTLLKDEVKQKIEESKKVLGEANKIKSEYFDKKREYEKLIGNQEKEIEKQIEQSKDEWVKNKGLNLDVGQIVWVIRKNDFPLKEIVCPHCNGKHNIEKIIDGRIFKSGCDICNWDGKICLYKYEVEQTNITSINIEISKGYYGDKDKGWVFNTTVVTNLNKHYVVTFIIEEDANKKCKEMNDKEEELFNSKIKGDK